MSSSVLSRLMSIADSWYNSRIGTLGATFVRPGLLTQFVSPAELGMPLQDIVEQSFLGCPEHILNPVKYFSLQRDAIAHAELFDGATVCQFIQDIKAVLESVQKFDCFGWVINLQRLQHSSTRDEYNLCNLSLSYKLGALVYGRRILDALTSNVTALNDLICKLMDAIGALRDTTLLSASYGRSSLLGWNADGHRSKNSSFSAWGSFGQIQSV